MEAYERKEVEVPRAGDMQRQAPTQEVPEMQPMPNGPVRQENIDRGGVSRYDEIGGISETENGISEITLNHSSTGDFTRNPQTGAISKMKGGGHGQENLDFLENNNIEYNIVKEYPNGVRVGNVPSHKVKSKREGTNQSWFPKSWSRADIMKAGEYVGNLSENRDAVDGMAVYGSYKGVRVGVIRTNGKISTIFPDATKQP